ncbi:OLC1v1004123C1 [Oldenlandia corymbosa var. corymbosa]|uniref:OLC1v1004123C1 n=1 Tax=Oldenlandia corymbosa var. corymbosa TaxID=529605 RepID=A0AAV1DE00_OLDCO|nr:OLC1v1004123C1 [Oldenlandia corymbosa var. corymbosa]
MKLLRTPKMARRNRINDDRLPLFSTRNSGGDSKRSFSKKWVHLIPIIVMFCFFVLWFFSYTVDLEVKDGRIAEFPKIDKPISLSETRVDIALLAVASPPYPSITHMQTLGSHTAAEPASVN